MDVHVGGAAGQGRDAGRKGEGFTRPQNRALLRDETPNRPGRRSGLRIRLGLEGGRGHGRRRVALLGRRRSGRAQLTSGGDG